MDEEWRAIPGYEDYEVSSLGRVKHLIATTRNRAGRILTATMTKNGYPRLGLRKNGEAKIWEVHRLVLLAFVGPLPAGQQTRHLDDNKQNPKLDNLVYGTRPENAADTIRVRGLQSPLTPDDVLDILRKFKEGVSGYQLAQEYNVVTSTIYGIIKGRTHKHLTGSR